jgi:hypothetical protein
LAVLGIVLAWGGHAAGQKDPPKIPPSAAGPGELSAVKFVESPEWRRVLNVGRDCIKDGDWKQAAEALQAVLEEKKDHYVKMLERDPADAKKEIVRWTSVKYEANRLLGTMPAKGLEVYESTYGINARTLLDEAKKKSDRALLHQVAMRYRHTKAGAEAYQALAKALEVARPRDWPSWRGNVTNSGQADGGMPQLDKKFWSRPIFKDKLDGLGGEDSDQPALDHVQAAIKQVSDLKQPVLPGSFPIVSQGIVVYRTPRDIRAVALKEREERDAFTKQVFKYKQGAIIWKTLPCDRTLSRLFELQKTKFKTEEWINAYQQVPGYTSFLYDNTVLGVLSTDEHRVYMIDDLSVPPISNMFQFWVWNQPQFNPQDMKPFLMSNELHAYDLLTGKRVWDLTSDLLEFKNSHFLGQPLTIGGKLYVLNEQNKGINGGIQPGKQFGDDSDLRLVCIDPNKINADGKPTIEFIQELARVKPPDRFVQDPRRRVNTVQLAFADGILVCPTNAGDVFGIDLFTRHLAWSYPYREEAAPQVLLGNMPNLPFPAPAKPPAVISKWKSAPPALQDGKIVFTAPDADSVHCIDLKSGMPLWRKPRLQGDLHLAGVFDGRVVIVSDKRIRALALKDGSELWSLAIEELPSGQGAASKGMYYLPLTNTVVAVDLAKGQIKARQAGVAPGNLVLHGNLVLSQTATEIVAYPTLP